jgi:hypothetical protein
VPGLLAQGRTIAETLEIARDVARKLLAARREQSFARRMLILMSSSSNDQIVCAGVSGALAGNPSYSGSPRLRFPRGATRMQHPQSTHSLTRQSSERHAETLP